MFLPINIISHLNRVGYDYLEMPKGGGITDDSKIIQARAWASKFNKGINGNIFGSGTCRIEKSIKFPTNITLNGE